MTALPQVEGVCGMCSRQLRRMRGMIGRRVEDMEEPLRQAVHGQTLVCDECLQSVQPVSRATGPSWACTRWAQRQSTSSPLCARNGWNCNNQKSETEAGRTKVLKLCRLFGSANPEYYLRKYEIPPYAAENCLCKKCYKEIWEADIPMALSTPASADTTLPSSKRGRAAITDAGRDCIASMRARARHQRHTMRARAINTLSGLLARRYHCARRPARSASS